MADVRLTATNPEDSSVVPVACDAAGRLLLEEPQVIEGPPGPPGEQGPPGQDGQNGQDGDPFSGNFAGDVTFGGSAEFDGNVQVGGNPATDDNDGSFGSKLTRAGSVQARRGNGGEVWVGFSDTSGTETSKIYAEGSAQFAGEVSFEGTWGSSEDIPVGRLGGGKGLTFIGGITATDGVALYNNSYQITDKTLSLLTDGSAKFAGGKAGFTAEGYLWCTTRRGDTVILDATSNGLASWIDYTPTTRLEEIRDRLDANRGDTGEMPTDTP